MFKIERRNGRYAVLNGLGACVAVFDELSHANEALRELAGGGHVTALFANKASTEIPQQIKTTVDDVRLGSAARAAERSGRLPGWVADGGQWANAKAAAARLIAGGSDEFYPVAAACYRMANDSGTSMFVAAHFMQPVGAGVGLLSRKKWQLKKPEPVKDGEPKLSTIGAK